MASGRISPAAAIAFGSLLGLSSFLLLALTVNPLAAALSLSGLFGYVFVYTLWLKRTTPQNIVIGGAAGAVPPLVAWAAVTGGLSGMAFFLFAIVFFWTPPHFWALSLLMKDEYAQAGVPMLPVVRGEDETRRQILLYTILLYAVTQLPFCAGGLGIAYLVPSMLLGAAFIYCAVKLLRTRRPPLGAAHLPLLARLPGAAVPGDGDRRPRLIEPLRSPPPLIEIRPWTARPRDATWRPAWSPAASPPASSPSPSSSRCSTSRMMSEHRQIPEPGELVYAPRPSWAPAVFAAAAALAVCGIFADGFMVPSWIFSIIGGVVLLFALRSMVRALGRRLLPPAPQAEGPRRGPPGRNHLAAPPLTP